MIRIGTEWNGSVPHRSRAPRTDPTPRQQTLSIGFLTAQGWIGAPEPARGRIRIIRLNPYHPYKLRPCGQPYGHWGTSSVWPARRPLRAPTLDGSRVVAVL